MAADRSIPSGRLDWETGAGKSYVIPALEIPGFLTGLNQFNRRALDSTDYDSDFDSIERNLRTGPELDKDPFSVNQIGHPYQGSIYHGFARSAGLTYWESLAYTISGSFLWETGGEKTRPSYNDHIATGIGGTFVGEAMFRMASLLLEGGEGRPGFWRELGAAVLSPPTGFNRLVFGDRFDAVFPSRDPAIFIRLRLGVTLSAGIDNDDVGEGVRRQEGNVDFSMIYGLPGKPGYRYTRPFDYFMFEFTAVPNARTVQNAIENLTIRGLLLGQAYELGDDYRGLWGLFGGYEYLSPQIFRVATTNFALGTVGQWWLARSVALQGTLLVGAGFGAAGTVGDRDERDYQYGVIPEALVGLRLIFGDFAMIEAQGRQYAMAGVGSGVGGSGESGRQITARLGHEMISRGTVGLTVAVYGPHAIGVQYLITTRDTTTPGAPDRHQSVQTVTIAYNYLGHRKFGAVEWRPAELSR